MLFCMKAIKQHALNTLPDNNEIESSVHAHIQHLMLAEA